MTLLPLNDWENVLPVEGERYKVAAKCCVPDCKHWTDHAHHLFRRSFLNGDFWWITINGKLTGNVVGLCWQHHLDVTGDVGGHRAWIRWWNGKFSWWTVNPTENLGLLDPQPPREPLTATLTASEPQDESEHVCPACGRRKSATRSMLPKRKRKSWLVSVPDDEEDGAVVLDTLVDECSKALGRHDHANRRYFVLVESLAFLLQHQTLFGR